RGRSSAAGRDMRPLGAARVGDAVLRRPVHSIEIAAAPVVETIPGPLRQTAFTTHEALPLLRPHRGFHARGERFWSLRFRVHARRECIKHATPRWAFRRGYLAVNHLDRDDEM